jgi:hypothetical protein
MTPQELYDFYNTGKKKAKFNNAVSGKATKGSNTPTPDLRFPSNIDSFPTYMQYTAYEYIGTGGIATDTSQGTGTAFGNVGAVEKELIKIYLPALKSDINENQSWESVSSNDALTAAVTAFSESDSGNIIGKGMDAAGAGVNAMMSSMKIGAANLKASGTGFGVMEQQALKYNGPEQRGLTCTYNFVPRSRDETDLVDKIIKKFRFHAAPKRGNLTDLSGDGTLAKMVSNDVGVRTYKFPSLFKIRWLDNKGNDNKWLPKYNTCYCESVAVEYGDEKFTTFDSTSGAPTTYTLTLTFKELDYPTKDRIDGGF